MTNNTKPIMWNSLLFVAVLVLIVAGSFGCDSASNVAVDELTSAGCFIEIYPGGKNFLEIHEDSDLNCLSSSTKKFLESIRIVEFHDRELDTQEFELIARMDSLETIYINNCTFGANKDLYSLPISIRRLVLSDSDCKPDLIRSIVHLVKLNSFVTRGVAVSPEMFEEFHTLPIESCSLDWNELDGTDVILWKHLFPKAKKFLRVNDSIICDELLDKEMNTEKESSRNRHQ